jgi:hypothetical protein
MVNINKNKESQIAGIVGNNRAVASGYLRLLSLDALRERMGPKWQSRADHIRFIAEGVIKRHLTKGQTYYQATDSAYVMVFDFDVEDRAEHVCRAIGREIVQRLLGASEGGPEDLSVEMRATVVPCDQLRGNANPAAAFEQCLAAAEPHLVSASDDDPGRPEPELTPVPAAESGEVRAPSSLVDRINALVHKTEQQLTAEAAGSRICRPYHHRYHYARYGRHRVHHACEGAASEDKDHRHLGWRSIAQCGFSAFRGTAWGRRRSSETFSAR